MYWFDIVSIGVVLAFGIMGLTGWLNRLRGLVFGVILGVVVIVMIPFALAKYDLDSRINPEKSVTMQYLDKYVPDSFKGKIARVTGPRSDIKETGHPESAVKDIFGTFPDR